LHGSSFKNLFAFAHTIIPPKREEKKERRKKEKDGISTGRLKRAVKLFWQNTTLRETEVWRFWQKPVGLELY